MSPGRHQRRWACNLRLPAIPEASLGGVTVTAIDPSGRVADSGLLAGDVILRVQQEPVSSPAQVEAALRVREAAKQPYAAVLVLRDDKETWIPIALPGG